MVIKPKRSTGSSLLKLFDLQREMLRGPVDMQEALETVDADRATFVRWFHDMGVSGLIYREPFAGPKGGRSYRYHRCEAPFTRPHGVAVCEQPGGWE